MVIGDHLVNIMAAEPREGGVFYEVETSAGSKGIVVYQVGEVYLYIPAESSAAGFELQIDGSVRITDRVEGFYLNWTPGDLTQQDVTCLYSAQADGWAMIDEFIEPPELIGTQEVTYRERDRNLDLPEPILKSPDERHPLPAKEQQEEATVAGTGVRYTKDGDAHITGIIHPSKPVTLTARPDAVNFPVSKLHSVREATLLQGRRSLTFFLTDGREMPTLYFHDGGTTGLLQALQRYLFLVRDPRDPSLLRVEEFNKTEKGEKLKPLSDEDRHTQPGIYSGHKKGLEHIFHGAVSGAVGNIIGITRAVRQHLLPDNKLLDVRPGTELDEDYDEKIQTVAMSEYVQPGANDKGSKGAEADPDASLITDFQIITDLQGKLPPRLPLLPRQPPVTVEEWESFRDTEGRITKPNEKRFRARVFAGGLDNKLRKEAWRFLLNYFPFDATDIERMELRRRREREYWTMKQQWTSFTEDQEKRFTQWARLKMLINKDVLRTDRELDLFKGRDGHKLIQLEDILRTYVMYNFDLGYVQGMSDLLAPVLAVMDNEVDTFWCFAGFMDMVGHHFEMSQTGMRMRLKQLRALLNVSDPEFYQFLKNKEANNLYFCFRWLLVNFKREFSYDDIMKVWEVIWTKYLSPDYALFIALAIIDLEKENLYKPENDFSDILQHINGLAKHIELNGVLELAEVLCRQLGSCPNLPEDLQSLVVRPMPRRLENIAESETVICDPDSNAVPTNDS